MLECWAVPAGDVTAAAAPVTFDNLITAIAAFERTLIYGNSPFDRYVFGGDHAALSEQAKRGMQLFSSPRAACGSCHSGLNFGGNWIAYRNTPQGREVLAVGWDEIERLEKKRLSRKERQSIVLGFAEPW